MALADPNEPLVLANGTKIDASGRVVKPQMTEIPANSAAREIVIRANRRIADLPSLPAQMNGVSVILTYTLFGLADTEIAIATRLTIEQIQQIRQHDSYIKMMTSIRENVIKDDEDRVRSIINQHTEAAAGKVVDLMASEDDKTALKASQDILDRGGHRPADIIEHRHSLQGKLLIEVIERDENVKLPTIEVEM